jgi:hypothetical protein
MVCCLLGLTGHGVGAAREPEFAIQAIWGGMWRPRQLGSSHITAAYTGTASGDGTSQSSIANCNSNVRLYAPNPVSRGNEVEAA